MPSFGSGEATAVARTTDSPWVTSAAPDACLAIRPVSKLSSLPPASSTVTSCFMKSSFLNNKWRSRPALWAVHSRPLPLHAAQRQNGRPGSDLKGESWVGKFLGGKDGENGSSSERLLHCPKACRGPRKAFASQRHSPAPAMRAIRAAQCRERIHLDPLPGPRIPS